MRLPFLLLILATPALAQGADPEPATPAPGRTFQPPAGCEAFLTVQMAACTVSHHFTCAADPEGWQRRVDMDEGGIAYAGAIDAETQWVESQHFLSGHSEALAPNPADPASFTELTTSGRDGFDFVTNSPQIGPTRYVGEDRLTGETVTIDGVTLDRTTYEIVATDPAGNEVWRSEGAEYISREWRMFLSGTGTTTLPSGESFGGDDSPVEFIYPGEPGFLSASPKHGCGEMMSKRVAP